MGVKLKDPLKKSTKAHTQYMNEDGIRVAGVTTILGILNKPALVKWANNLGLQGIDSTKYVDKAASVGTLAHLMVQDFLSGREGNYEEYSPDDLNLAENSMIKFYDWIGEHKITPIMVETPLVSEIYQYGGTVDCYAELNGKATLIDFETSSGIWPEMFHQVAAYKKLLEEHGREVEQVRILRIGRSEDEGFEDHIVTNIVKHWEIFEACLRIYNLQKQIRKGA